MSSRTSPNYATVNETQQARIQTPKANGRVDIVTDAGRKLNVPGYGPISPENNSTFCQEALMGNWDSSELSKTFFSVDNIEALHQGIRYLVHTRSNGRFLIGRQSDQELKIIMKGIYLQNAKHSQGTGVLEQIRDLNRLVLEFAVQQVMTNLEQYDRYRIDISTLPTPMERSQPVSEKGTRLLELKNFI